MKNCEACGKEFEVVQGRGMNNRITCYECTDGNRKITWRNKHLKRNYGMTLYQVRQMYEEQNGQCAICTVNIKFDNGNYRLGEKRDGTEMCVDHCHNTKKVRGLLCFHCNVSLGHIFDKPEAIKRMIEYVS